MSAYVAVLTNARPRARTILRPWAGGFDAPGCYGVGKVECSAVDRDGVYATDEFVRVDLSGTFEHRVGTRETADHQRVVVEVECTIN